MSTTHTSRRRRASVPVALASALTLTIGLGLTGLPAGAASPTSGAAAVAAAAAVSGPMQTAYCGLVWGSLGKTNGSAHTSGSVSNVRAGRHACYDRLVIDVANVPKSLTYDVRYVDAVHEDGSGKVVPLAGAADLQVILRAPASKDGAATYTPKNRSALVNVTGWSTFRQVALAGSFEGQTTIGLGVRARLPFRVLVLDGPGNGARLVVDVAHKW